MADQQDFTFRSDAPLVVTSPVTITYVTTLDNVRGFRTVELPEPLKLTAGAYTVNVKADDTVTIERV